MSRSNDEIKNKKTEQTVKLGFFIVVLILIILAFSGVLKTKKQCDPGFIREGNLCVIKN